FNRIPAIGKGSGTVCDRRRKGQKRARLEEKLMKPVLYSTIAALVMLAGLTTRAHSQTQQPLGDYARALKKEKSASAKSSKTYDNDTMPNTGTVSVVGAAAAESDNKDDAATNNAEAKGPEVKAGQSTEDREKALSEWKQRID